MARKVTREIARAFKNGEKRAIKSTMTDGQAVYLHGHKIAWRENGKVYANMCGWGTVTTRERLNGICDALDLPRGFSQKNHSQYYGDREISKHETVELI